MAKKKSIAKAFVGVTALAVAGKVVYDKYKILKEKFEKEETESICDEVKKYNAVCTSKSIEIEDEDFEGCEIKAIASKLILDLSLAVFEKDAYINFKSDASIVQIILPEGVNVTCDIENVASGIKNLVQNAIEEGIPTVFIIGKSTISSIEIIPANFYSDDDEFEDENDFEPEDVTDEKADKANEKAEKANEKAEKANEKAEKANEKAENANEKAEKADEKAEKADEKAEKANEKAEK
ncbi:alanine-zipper protein [[Clostridium] fimetarium]|uniref:Uncharacterized protein n=1 Tax=[Clostridium] fimetarium TaxID=99656 RepID=A0A1I0NJ16_9FIRM|nr:alanine-zipper protein [[Clostridium] fimetarium]SEW01435.1 Protein of unknown function [[Clostridium] fimetarium]